MGVITVEQEISCSLSRSRLFKSFVFDAKLMPKIMPNFFKSFETVQGTNGEVGSILLVTLTAEVGGDKMKPAKHKVEEVDEENYVYKYSLIEGGILGDHLESVTYVYKFEEGPTGAGCTIKIVKTYKPKDEEDEEHHSIIQEIIDRSKEVTKGFINAIESHLHENPHE